MNMKIYFPDEYQKMYNRYVPSIINGNVLFAERDI